MLWPQNRSLVQHADGSVCCIVSRSDRKLETSLMLTVSPVDGCPSLVTDVGFFFSKDGRRYLEIVLNIDDYILHLTHRSG